MVGLMTLNDLEIALRQNMWLGEVLERFEEVALPDSWLVAGCIAQTIWNLGHGQPAEFGLKDDHRQPSYSGTQRSRQFTIRGGVGSFVLLAQRTRATASASDHR